MTLASSPRSALVALAFVFAVGCGGGVEVGIAPASPTVTAGGTVDLTASGPTIVKYTLVTWRVDEDGGDAACTSVYSPPAQPTPPTSGCAAGWLSVEQMYGFVPNVRATYHAPSTAGTFHVTAHVENLDHTTGDGHVEIRVP